MFTTYRRGKLESGDIDVLLTHPSYTSTEKKKKKSQLLKDVVKSLVSKKLIIDTISLGDVKFMVSLFWQFCRKYHCSLSELLNYLPDQQKVCPWQQFIGVRGS
jgi:hypothetical protein